MTRKTVLIGGAAILAVTVPAVAQMARPERPALARADVEAQVRRHFAMLDTNKDGFVTASEIDSRRENARGKMFDRLDTDKNGAISRSEFDAAHGNGAGHMGASHMGGEHEMGKGMGMGLGGPMLMMADADKDGRVSLNEAVAGALRMFDRADTDKNGIVTAQERRAAWQAMRANWRAKNAG